ncbi:MAG: hypothetical protein NVSMB6_07900 [Burkholderiaceae bacterium]
MQRPYDDGITCAKMLAKGWLAHCRWLLAKPKAAMAASKATAKNLPADDATTASGAAPRQARHREHNLETPSESRSRFVVSLPGSRRRTYSIVISVEPQRVFKHAVSARVLGTRTPCLPKVVAGYGFARFAYIQKSPGTVLVCTAMGADLGQ